MKFIFIIISLVLITSVSKSQMFVNFGADTTYACDSVLVSFYDSSAAFGGITKWRWDFGNNKTDTIKNPTCLYDTAGVYTVKLVISSPTQTDSLIKTNYIIVKLPAELALFYWSLSLILLIFLNLKNLSAEFLFDYQTN